MATIASALQTLDQLVDALVEQRDRINRERMALLAGTFSGLGFLGIGELQTRADSMLALLQSIDRHVGEVLPRMEAKARAGDAKAAGDAVESTSRILRAVGGVSPASDLLADTSKLVKGIVDDAQKASIGIGVIAVVVAAVVLLLKAR